MNAYKSILYCQTYGVDLNFFQPRVLHAAFDIANEPTPLYDSVQIDEILRLLTPEF